MKKRLRNILIGLLVLLGLAKFSGAIAFYSIPTTATEPNLKLGSHFIGTNLIFPERLDFAYYKASDSVYGNYDVVQRLIAFPGDIIESKRGVIFVNSENIDSELNLRRMFIINNVQYKSIEEDIEDDTFILKDHNNEHVIVPLDEYYVEKLNFKPVRFFSDNKDVSSDIKSKSQNWNFHDFGPITLPKNKYFFLGDNRDNSFDSRYRGFIDKKNIKGKLLFQF